MKEHGPDCYRPDWASVRTLAEHLYFSAKEREWCRCEHASLARKKLKPLESK